MAGSQNVNKNQVKNQIKKRGRPTKYNSKYHDKWGSALARLGYIDSEIAKEFGISESTITTWKAKYKSFSGALKKGKEEPDDRVENALFNRAIGFEKKAIKIFQYQGKIITKEYNEYYPPEVGAMCFWLKNRRPDKWRDKHEVHSFNAPLTMADLHKESEDWDKEHGK